MGFDHANTQEIVDKSPEWRDEESKRRNEREIILSVPVAGGACKGRHAFSHNFSRK